MSFTTAGVEPCAPNFPDVNRHAADGHSYCLATLYPSTPCNLTTLENCDCYVLNDTAPGARGLHDTISAITEWEEAQAVLQLIVSLLSFVLGLAYVVCFAFFPSKLMRYPLSLALQIYVFELFISLQFILVSAMRLRYEDRSTEATYSAWLVSSNPDCLCDWRPDEPALKGAAAPGCVCRNGLLSFMLMAGGVGSVGFFVAMVHNEYRSVRDPFTSPRSRLSTYLFWGYGMTLLFSTPYLVPAEGIGYGYRREFLMCWSPSRDANWQSRITTGLPIMLVLLVVPVWFTLYRRLLTTGGFDALSPARQLQLQSGDVVVITFLVYWGLTSLCYTAANLPQLILQYTTTSPYCADYGDYQVKKYEGYTELSDGQCYFTACFQAAFSVMLCAGGAVNALAGFRANRDLLRKGLEELRGVVRQWLVARSSGCDEEAAEYNTLTPLPRADSAAVARAATELLHVTDGTESTFSARRGLGDLEASRRQKEPDISKTLRLDVIKNTMRGIRMTVARDLRESDTRLSSVAASCNLPSCGLPELPRPASEHSFRSTRAVDSVGAAAAAEGSLAAPLCTYLPTGLHNDSSSTTPTQPATASLPSCAPSGNALATTPLSDKEEPAGEARSSSGVGAAGPSSTTPPCRPATAEGGGAGASSNTDTDDVPPHETLRQWARRTYEVPDFGANAKFKVYGAEAWQWLRQRVYRVSAEAYQDSMTEVADNEMKHNFSEASGGGFFFFSSDCRYMVKTMDHSEMRALLAILPFYCEHLLQHPRSLLARISGCYSIQLYGQTKFFMVIDNLFDPAEFANGRPDEKFDLKGSWVDRHTSAGESTRKDSDWTATRKLRLSACQRKQLLRQAQYDARFLCSCRLMDYSMLLGIQMVEEARVFVSPSCEEERLERAAELQYEIRKLQAELFSLAKPDGQGSSPVPSRSSGHPPALDPDSRRDDRPPLLASSSSSAVLQSVRARSEGPLSYSADLIQGPGEYRLGIIDLLQEWNWKKKIERWCKILLKRRCSSDLRNGMSCVEPNEYARRFHLMVGMKVLGMSQAEVLEDWEEGSKHLAQHRWRHAPLRKARSHARLRLARAQDDEPTALQPVLLPQRSRSEPQASESPAL